MGTEISTSVTISNLDAQISALTEKLAPATERDVAGFLRSLMAAGLAMPSPIEPERSPAIYGYSLAGLPLSCIERVAKKLLRGEYDREYGFLPKPPEFAQLVRAEEAVIRADVRRQREIRQTRMELEEQKSRPAPSEESRARVRALVESVRRNMTPPGESEARHGR